MCWDLYRALCGLDVTGENLNDLNESFDAPDQSFDDPKDRSYRMIEPVADAATHHRVI
jgi:hypothetical protein